MLEVVIIDDDKIEAEGNKRRVLHMNHPEIESVRAFTSSEEALDYLEQTSHLTLVIIDINMPGMSGLLLMEIMQARPEFRFIVVSAYDNFKYAQQSMIYGVKYYLLKPCSYEELKKAVETTILEWDREVLELQGKMTVPWSYVRRMAELSASEKKDKEYHVSVRWALDYIDRHISEKLNMAFLANKRNLNYSYFSQLFKKETGYTFSDYVNMRRMQIAGERLLEGAGTEEVSEAVGFESVKSFFRAFKSYYKMSPSAWKKEHSGRN